MSVSDIKDIYAGRCTVKCLYHCKVVDECDLWNTTPAMNAKTVVGMYTKMDLHGSYLVIEVSAT